MYYVISYDTFTGEYDGQSEFFTLDDARTAAQQLLTEVTPSFTVEIHEDSVFVETVK